MILNVNGQDREVAAYSVAYPNDLLDGCLLDLGNQYGFLSDHIESHREAQAEIEDLEFYDMSDCEIDYSIAPHSWVVTSVAKLVIREAELIISSE